MIDILKEIEANLPQLLLEKAEAGTLKTLYIDYHKPYVKRIWFQHGEFRVFLHKIEKCNESSEALYHPHPWKSAVKIVSGSYEMGVGHSSTNETPATDCKLLLNEGTIYEMLESNGWHYVSPKDQDSYSLMVTGELNSREMPITPLQKFRKLQFEEITDILYSFNSSLRSGEINKIACAIIDKPELM